MGMDDFDEALRNTFVHSGIPVGAFCRHRVLRDCARSRHQDESASRHPTYAHSYGRSHRNGKVSRQCLRYGQATFSRHIASECLESSVFAKLLVEDEREAQMATMVTLPQAYEH